MASTDELGQACCTCAILLSSLPPAFTRRWRSQLQPADGALECCGRTICCRCTTNNPRFNTYCPFCQVSVTPSSLPQGLRDPPCYEEGDQKNHSYVIDDNPPPYDEGGSVEMVEEKHPQSLAEDVLHFVCPKQDTVSSLSLRYGVPIWAFRSKNNLYTDHLLAARRAVLIPGDFYKGGVSLSPRPPDGEEEERRKTSLRRFMTTCKVHDYDVAELYLKQAQYDLDLAIGVYQDDERWEKANPLKGSKGKGKVLT